MLPDVASYGLAATIDGILLIFLVKILAVKAYSKLFPQK
jgi:hypothetical protein